MKNPNWTREEDEILKQNIGNVKSVKELCSLFTSRNKNAIANRVSFLKLIKHTEYTKDEAFFQIPNILNSSIAGILSSDGHLSPRLDNRSARVFLGLKTDDKIIIEKFRELTKSNYKITSTSKNTTYAIRGPVKKYLYEKTTICFSQADKWIEDLYKNWNIPTGAKSLIIEPPKNLIDMDHCLAYISGLVTGDGSIFINGPIQEHSIRISFLGTEKLLLWIKQTLEKYLNKTIKATIRKVPTSNIYTFYLDGINAAIFINKINNMNVLKLDRKWKKKDVLQVVNELKYKYPNLFNENYVVNLADTEPILTNILNTLNINYQINDKNSYEIPSKNTIIKLIKWTDEPEINKQKELEPDNTHVISIFENELINKTKIVQERIKNYLGLTKYRIYARKCIIQEVDHSLKNKFLNKYHIQGQDYGGSKNLGLFYKNRLVSLMTFGKVRLALGYKKIENQYELIRFCSISGFNVVGGASKLLNYFEKTYKPIKLLSFADKRWSQGNLYYKLGFEYKRTSKPNYWYLNKERNRLKLYHRFNYRKQELPKLLKIFNPQISEWENMKANGWSRVWDCGNMVFEKIYTNSLEIPSPIPTI